MSCLPILMYHHVGPAPGLVTISPAIFREQIAALAAAGWQSVGTAELEAFYAGQPLPPKSLLISFDDGYLDNWLHAHPVLQEYGMKAVLFVVTGWIGDGPVRSRGDCPDHRECKRRIAAGETDSVMLRWSEIDAMRAAGSFEFHSHTHTHTRWDQKIADNAQRLAAIAEELTLSRAMLEQRLGLRDEHLCWPQGYYQADYLPLAEKAGFRYLYTTQPGTNRRGDGTLQLRRIVTKEKGGNWVVRRAKLYSSIILASLYTHLK